MANELSTNGIKIYYAPETTAGTKPTTGWVEIPDVVSIPAIGSTPDTIEVTPLSETEYKRYIKGLKDTGAQQLTGNMTTGFVEGWNTLQTAYDTAKQGGKSIWYAVIHPEFEKAFFFTGEPDDIPLPAAGSNQAWQPTPSIIVNRVHGWDTKPEIPAA